MNRADFIPILPLVSGAGSQPQQPGDEAWSCLPLPVEVETWRAPAFPEPGEPGVAAVLHLLRGMIDALESLASPDEAIRFPLDALDTDAHRLLAQVFGEGEVSARVACDDGATVQIQEARYAGVWRVITVGAQGERIADYVEIAPAPSVVFEASARGAAHAAIPPVGEATLMNAPSLASEIAAIHARAVQTGGAGQHTINFSLLPVSPDDLAWLEGMLGEGRVGLFSTGYGKCMVMATALRHVWRVRYFDGANKVLLDTVEITRLPEVVLAAPDDLRDSLQHLREIVQWLESH
ncbi:hydrogenase expression/formation protein [Paraburkholderia sp. Ac-20347]|uniref:hydrogenase expression/formation protein n=1 Tax=Paraburkholderia sp. Ac-20347 TaxID=2703892 RepID=UPI00197D67E3|nr:hydrogenase expression/formation protein [Paraburkholderia sp. Ac-20347]MBN3812954.1 hydrogenase expression/formation protein [Paraburkholderia sp. Ac-20347]